MLGDTPRPLTGSLPSKLQPLFKGQASRTHQIFADVEKILGRAPAHCRTELGDQQGLEKPQPLTEKIYLGFPDPEIEELEMRSRQLKPGTLGPDNTGPFQNRQDALESKTQASVHAKLSETLKGPQLRREEHRHDVAKRSSTGPGGDKGQSPVPSPSPEEAPSPSLIIHFVNNFISIIWLRGGADADFVTVYIAVLVIFALISLIPVAIFRKKYINKIKSVFQ